MLFPSPLTFLQLPMEREAGERETQAAGAVEDPGEEEREACCTKCPQNENRNQKKPRLNQ